MGVEIKIKVEVEVEQGVLWFALELASSGAAVKAIGDLGNLPFRRCTVAGKDFNGLLSLRPKTLPNS
jgi:hypothetical protein